VNASKLKALKIPLPPLLDQKRIATILDKADAIRRKRQASIRLADDFLRSVFLDMFGDPVTNPKGWPMVKLSEIGQLDRGVSKHRPRNAPELLGGTFPLIQTGDIANSGGYIRDFTQTYSETGLRQSKIWPVGTLCITIAANIAKTGILTFDACFPDSVVGFIPYSDQTTTEFAQWWLSFLQEGLEESAPESAQKNINLKILRDLDVVCPPFSQQCQFSQIVRRARKHAENTAASTRAANDLFQSLSHRAFAGEL
jgi:type I restriction enzyme S subunit